MFIKMCIFPNIYKRNKYIPLVKHGTRWISISSKGYDDDNDNDNEISLFRHK